MKAMTKATKGGGNLIGLTSGLTESWILVSLDSSSTTWMVMHLSFYVDGTEYVCSDCHVSLSSRAGHVDFDEYMSQT